MNFQLDAREIAAQYQTATFRVLQAPTIIPDVSVSPFVLGTIWGDFRVFNTWPWYVKEMPPPPQLTILSETFLYLHLLEGPRQVVKLFSRHREHLVAVYIMEMVHNASWDIGFRRLNKTAWHVHVNEVLNLQAGTRRVPLKERKRKGNIDGAPTKTRRKQKKRNMEMEKKESD